MTHPPYGTPGGPPPPWGYPSPGGQAPTGYQPGFPGQQGPPPQAAGGFAWQGPPQGGFNPPQPSPPRRRKTVAWIFVPLVAVIAVGVFLVVGLVTPGLLVRTVYNPDAVQLGVQQILRDSYKLGAVDSVRCPPGIPVEPSRTFECQVRVGDKDQRVRVRIKNTDGVYEVGYPR